MKYIIILMISIIMTSCGSGGSDPNNPNNVHEVVTNLGMYVGYKTVNIITADGRIHEWYQLYTTQVQEGIYLMQQPPDTYAIFVGNTQPFLVILRQKYDNNGPTNDPANVDVGNDPSHVDEFLAYVPGKLYQ